MQYFAQQFSFATRQVLSSIASYEKNEQVQQANMFKRQTLPFHFSTCRPNSFKHLSHHMLVRLHQRIDCCNRCVGRRNTATRFFLINNTFVTMNKLLTPSMYCWSRKILFTIHWTYFRRNGICAKFFCPQKTNNRTITCIPCGMLSVVMLPYLMLINDVTVTSS